MSTYKNYLGQVHKKKNEKKKHHIGKLKYSKTSHTQQYHTITICNIQVIKFNCLLIQ